MWLAEKRKNGNVIPITDTRILFSEIVLFSVSKNKEMKQLSFINLETSFFLVMPEGYMERRKALKISYFVTGNLM